MAINPIFSAPARTPAVTSRPAPAAQATPTQDPSTPTVASDLVSLNGQVMDPGDSAQTGSKSAEMAAAAASGLPGLALAYFSPREWSQLNPGRYHDESHPVHVAETVGEVASNLGRSPERANFLQQVALLHDVDERIDLKSGQQNPVTPARVPVTLEWMDRNSEALSERMGWNSTDLLEAKTLIARTDFPFNDAPKNLGTRYDGQAPVQLYENLLQQLPPERRQQTMEDGLVLRFADQTANYTGGKEQARHYVQGLVEEFQGVGIPINFETMAKGNPTFLASAGTDLEVDWHLADTMHLNKNSLASRDNLMQALPDKRRASLEYLQNNPLT